MDPPKGTTNLLVLTRWSTLLMKPAGQIKVKNVYSGGCVMSKCIMMVDDFGGVRRMVSSILKEAGYEVVEAKDGRDALTKLESTPVHMVITDLNMPNLDGMGLVKGMRANAAYKYIPVIMLTTESGDLKKQEGIHIGVTGWLVKPFKPEQLLDTVRKVLG
jgi:two-component system chemotaxis response regulator CheY